jgi:ribonuclease VapC
MVLDSSAIVAIHLREEGYERLFERIGQAEAVFVGAPTVFESAMVLGSRAGRDVRSQLAAFFRRKDVAIVPFTEEHFQVATEAFLRFGKGHHPAKLNFGDCMAYAVAAVAGMPLLYTGNDFAQTDIPAA